MLPRSSPPSPPSTANADAACSCVQGVPPGAALEEFHREVREEREAQRRAQAAAAAAAARPGSSQRVTLQPLQQLPRDDLYEGDSFVDEGAAGAAAVLGEGDEDTGEYTTTNNNNNNSNNHTMSFTSDLGPGERPRRTAAGAIHHVPSSAPAGTGPVTATAPVEPHVGAHSRSALSLRDVAAAEGTTLRRTASSGPARKRRLMVGEAPAGQHVHTATDVARQRRAHKDAKAARAADKRQQLSGAKPYMNRGLRRKQAQAQALAHQRRLKPINRVHRQDMQLSGTVEGGDNPTGTLHATASIGSAAEAEVAAQEGSEVDETRPSSQGAGRRQRRQGQSLSNTAPAAPQARAIPLTHFEASNPPPYRLEPSFYLVDRRAVPARLPPKLQAFWDRNPQLLPKDALGAANWSRKDKARAAVTVQPHRFGGVRAYEASVLHGGGSMLSSTAPAETHST